MRQAYKVWAGITAGVFCLVAITDLSNGSSSSSPAPAALSATSSTTPSSSVTTLAVPAGPVTISMVVSPANITLSDGRNIHVPMMNGVLPWQGQYTNACQQAADLSLATKMLADKVVVATVPRMSDTAVLVPAGYTQADVAVGGVDYATTFESQAYSSRDQACPTPSYTPPPTSTSSPRSSSTDSGDFNGPSPGDQGLPDGTLTGGYCRKKWWC